MKKSIRLILGASVLALTMGVATSALAARHKEGHHERRSAEHVLTNPVDINTADAKTLAMLKGFGNKRAVDIVAYRKSHGPFRSLDDLTKVKGIGAKSLARVLKNNPGKVVIK